MIYVYSRQGVAYESRRRRMYRDGYRLFVIVVAGSGLYKLISCKRESVGEPRGVGFFAGVHTAREMKEIYSLYHV